jgi:fibronectin-binding autotransporter adhesin
MTPPKLYLLLGSLFLFSLFSNAQSTSWKGTTSTAWGTSGNWTNGVPSSTKDVIIGDANFTGLFQPTISSTSTAKSITIGNAAKVSTLTVSRGLTVSGDVLIGSNGTITSGAFTISLTGNWTKNGTYSTTSSTAGVIFAGTTQSITVSGSTQTFRRLTVNTGSVVTATAALTINVLLTVNGTFDPGTFAHTIASITVANAGTLHTKTSTLSGNYSGATLTLSAGSIVNYSSTTTNQTVNNAFTYSTLRISGTGTKTLAGNLLALRSASATQGNIFVDGGTLDLSTFTAARGTSVAGGTFSVANGATLKIGGVNTFPANYTTRTFGLGSTVEYSGTAQTISAQAYGNLTFSSSAGSVIKTMPATVMTISGNLTSMIGLGSGVSFTAAANMKITGNVNIGASTTFNASSFIDSVGGNWVNNGTFTGSTGSVVLTGPTTSISGAGTHSFNNLTMTSAGVSATATAITVSGNLATTASGTFTHASSGTLTMSGTTKTISGTGIIFDNLTISGTVTTASTFSLTGDLSIAGSLTASTGTITMSGSSKTISGAGTKSFSALTVTGSVTTAVNFSIASGLNVSGTLSATTPSVATFSGSATLNGTANLFNVTLTGTQLSLATNANLGVASTLLISAGTLNVTGTTPNTVTFNGSSTQTVNGITYNNLVIANGSTKTAGAAITVNSDLTINSSTTFAASTFTHSVYGNWINSGTFTAGSSTVQFLGAANSTITGSTTFSTLVVNKGAAATGVTLLSNVTVPTLTMTTGWMSTGSNTINITSTRTGTGIIYGNIQRTHAFNSGTAYEFESPDNRITFSAANTVSSITVTVTQGAITDFPFNGSISRAYAVAVAGSMGAASATLRLHYEDNELNGNSESSMQLWRLNAGVWSTFGKTGNNATSNYVEQSGITDLVHSWTLSDNANVVRWTGAVSTAWSTPGNWTVTQGSASTPPATGDIVQLGTVAISNQPSISTSVGVKNIIFGSTSAISLTVASGGSLTTNGINGSWSTNTTHDINVGAQTLTVNGDLSLSDNTSGHAINLSIGTGTVTITGSLTESGGANLTFSGAGTLNIGNNFTYSSGTFTPGAGTVVYNGTLPQTVAGVSYNNLTINKTAGIASKNATATINGNLTVSAGELDINIATAVLGNVSIASGATINGDGITTSVSGNWSNSGTFISATGTVLLNGTGSQAISASTFNNLTINKASGTATLGGNVTANGNISVLVGILDMAGFTANRSLLGGTFTMSAGTALLLTGANAFPSNYSVYAIDAASTVTYNGTSAQTVAGVSYGNLIFSNGTTNAKTLGASVSVNGDLTINSGATFGSDSFTITLGGNWLNNGTFTPSTGTVIFGGTSKTITGNTTFNRMAITGSYTVSNNDININGRFFVTSTGSYTAGSGTHIVNGDFLNSGVLTSTGVTTFSGTTEQTIQLINAVISNSFGVINFNGTIPPVLNSNSVPTYATLNVNNTGGVTASVGWKVLVSFTIGSGATFNGGNFTDTISGAFTNNGTVTSSGTLFFNPTTSVTVALGSGLSSTGTVRFGGTGTMTITGTPAALNDVIISNTIGISPPSGWTIAGNFAIRSNAIFNAGSFTYNIAGNIESNGTLNGGASTFTMSADTGELSGSGSTTFHNLTITGTGNIMANSDFSVDGNFTNNGIFDGSIGTLIMTGTGSSTIGGSTSPTTIAHLEVSKTNATATLAVNVSDIEAVEVLSGTLSASSFSLTEDAGLGVLTVNDLATLQLGGSNTLPTFTAYDIDTLSTIEYNGTGTQAISVAVSYGNLILSGSSTKTVSAGFTVLNNFSQSSGTFNGGSFTHTLKGNWTMTGGTFTNTGTTVLLNGTTDQTIKSTGAFNNLTINKASASVYDSTDVTVNGTLTLTSGNIITRANKQIIGAAGSVSRTSGHIIGNLQKNVALGATSRTFEIGDATGYTPLTIGFGNVTLAGELVASTTAGDHSDIANSQINPSKSVNRFWTYTNSGIVFNSYTLTLTFLPGDVDGGASTSDFIIANNSGGTWSFPTIGTRTATTTQASGLTTFGDFVIGELGARGWDGGAATNSWTDANNWNPNGVPAITEDAWIKIAATVQISSSVTINGLVMDNAAATASLQTGGSLIVNGVLTLTTGELQINGQTLNLNGTIAPAGTGTIKGAAGSSLTIGGSSGGSFGILRMSATSPNNRVQNFTLNRTGVSGGVETGSNGLEVTSTVTLTNGTLTTGGNLTLISSDLTNTARIAKIESTAGISGNVIVQRFIPAGTARRYEFWGSPVSNFTLAQLFDDIHITGPGGSTNGFDDNESGNPSVYTYTESVSGPSANGWVNPASINTAITSGAGMRIFYRGNRSQGIALLEDNPPAPQATVLDYVGTVNTGTISLPVSCSNGCGTNDGWNLVANPYPSPIDWNAASGWTKTNVSSSISIYNPAVNAYAAWDGAVGVNGGSRYIPIGQSYYLKATGGSPALSMNEDVKVSNLPGTQMFKQETLKYIRIRMIKDSSNIDETVIKFDAKATKDYNEMEDASKLFNAVINISSLDGNVPLVINNFPDIQKKDSIKLNIYANQPGSFTFHFSEFYNMPPQVAVYLKDAYTHTTIDVSESRIFNFAVTQDSLSQGRERFSLLFVNTAVPTSVNEVTGNDSDPLPLKIYPVPAKEQVYITGIAAKGTGELKVLNLLGQVIFSKQVTTENAESVIPVEVSELKDGIYFIEITGLGESSFTGKFTKQ